MTVTSQKKPSNTLAFNKQAPNALFIGFMLFSALALSYSFWVQRSTEITPCKLCILQQASYFLVVLISLLGLLVRHKSVLIILKTILILAAGAAGYHALVQFGVIKDLCIRHSPIAVEQFDSILLQSLDTPLQSPCSSKSVVLLGLPLSIYNFVIFATLYCFIQFLAAKLFRIKIRASKQNIVTLDYGEKSS